MTCSNLFKVISVVVTTFMLLSCGSSKEPQPIPVTEAPLDDPVNGIEGGGLNGIEGGGIVSAINLDFSKVTISGASYDSAAVDLQVLVDDQIALISDLRAGYTIKFTAKKSASGADPILKSIETLAELEGPVTAGSIDLDAQTFQVLGQTVKVVTTTEFDDELQPSGINLLEDGSLVEVSGFAIDSGLIQATRIELNQESEEFEVFGRVENLDAASFIFSIGNLEVNYASATLDGYSANMGLMNGDFVEAEGAMFDGNGVLIATEIENQSSSFGGEDGDEGDIEGVLTRFVSATDFDVAGFPVTTDAETEFERGSSADLMVGVKVKVEGIVDTNGVLVAKKVEFTADESESSVSYLVL